MNYQIEKCISFCNILTGTPAKEIKQELREALYPNANIKSQHILYRNLEARIKRGGTISADSFNTICLVCKCSADILRGVS